MEILQNIFFFLVAIIVLVAVHEAGHFLMARACGVFVERFSLGFGPVLFSYKSKIGTEYSISLIPLGGYVKMYGEKAEGESVLEAKTAPESEEPVARAIEEQVCIDPERIHESFAHKKVWQRFLIVAAGPFCNIILAWILYTATFMVGVQDFKPVFNVAPNTPAAIAGLRNGDLIKSVNGTEVIDFEEAIYHLLANIGDEVELTVAGDIGSAPVRTVKLSLAGWEMDPEKRKFLDDLGLAPKQVEASLVLAHIEKDSAAAKAGLKVYDKLIFSNGVKINSWDELSQQIRSSLGTPLELKVERGEAVKFDFLASIPAQMISQKEQAELASLKAKGQLTRETVTLTLVPKVIESDGKSRGYAGIGPFAYPVKDAFFVRQYGMIDSVIAGYNKTLDMSLVTFKIIKKFITGDISPKNVSGPIGIAKGAGLTARLGLEVFIGFMALISVNLGVLNLLPVPVLDGGHLFFYIIEAIRGKPLPEKVMTALMKTGLFLLLLLMVLAMFNDIYFNW